jgi:hypothetical protein
MLWSFFAVQMFLLEEKKHEFFSPFYSAKNILQNYNIDSFSECLHSEWRFIAGPNKRKLGCLQVSIAATPGLPDFTLHNIPKRGKYT